MNFPTREKLIEAANRGNSMVPSTAASTFPPESSGSRKSRGQKAHLPKSVMTAGRTNNPENRTTATANASIGPRDRKEPKDANARADIARIVVPADPAIDGPTLDIAARIHCHLSECS